MQSHWRLIVERNPCRGFRNMAVDHALLEDVRSGGRPVLRFYRWSPACLSFGRNQAVGGVCDTERLVQQQIDIVRRPTGGLAVLHDREVTYSVAVSVGSLGSPRKTYSLIGRALVEGLRRLGVPAAIANGKPDARSAPLRPIRDAAVPCFSDPIRGEVVAGGSKLVGSAQRCEGRTILQHGSILLGGDQSRVSELLGASGAVSRAGTSLERVLGREPDAGDVTEALLAGFRDVLGVELAPLVAPQPELERRARELEARYASAEWTWRR